MRKSSRLVGLLAMVTVTCVQQPALMQPPRRLSLENHQSASSLHHHSPNLFFSTTSHRHLERIPENEPR